MQSKKGANESTTVDDTKSQPNGSVLFQFIAAVVVSLQAGQYGIAGGWASPNIYYLKGNHSKLPSGTITVEEATWVTSILPIGIFTGSLLYGVIANRIGRKWSFISLTPIIIVSKRFLNQLTNWNKWSSSNQSIWLFFQLSWLLIAFAENVIYLYAARLIQGVFSGAIYSLCQFYFVEIADDRVRGTLCGTLVGGLFRCFLIQVLKLCINSILFSTKKGFSGPYRSSDIICVRRLFNRYVVSHSGRCPNTPVCGYICVFPGHAHVFIETK